MAVHAFYVQRNMYGTIVCKHAVLYVSVNNRFSSCYQSFGPSFASKSSHKQAKKTKQNSPAFNHTI